MLDKLSTILHWISNYCFGQHIKNYNNVKEWYIEWFFTILHVNFSGNFRKFSEYKRCSYKFHKIHRKTPVLESLFKETTTQMRHCEFCKIFKNSFFTEHLLPTTFLSAFLVKMNIWITHHWNNYSSQIKSNQIK